jgi:hypothetical protein
MITFLAIVGAIAILFICYAITLCALDGIFPLENKP